MTSNIPKLIKRHQTTVPINATRPKRINLWKTIPKPLRIKLLKFYPKAKIIASKQSGGLGEDTLPQRNDSNNDSSFIFSCL